MPTMNNKQVSEHFATIAAMSWCDQIARISIHSWPFAGHNGAVSRRSLVKSDPGL